MTQVHSVIMHFILKEYKIQNRNLSDLYKKYSLTTTFLHKSKRFQFLLVITEIHRKGYNQQVYQPNKTLFIQNSCLFSYIKNLK